MKHVRYHHNATLYRQSIRIQTYTVLLFLLDFLAHIGHIARNVGLVTTVIAPPRLGTVAGWTWRATFFPEVMSFFVKDKLTSQHENASCSYYTNDTVLPVLQVVTETILSKHSVLETGFRRSMLQNHPYNKEHNYADKPNI